jgi:hypothetical protein
MSLVYCADCTTAYAPDLPSCPHCWSIETHSEEDNVGKITGAGVSNEPGDDPAGWPDGAVLGGPSRDISPHDPLATAAPAVLESQQIGDADRSFVYREPVTDDRPGDVADDDTDDTSGAATSRKRNRSGHTEPKDGSGSSATRSDKPVTITPADGSKSKQADDESTGGTGTGRSKT